MGVRVIVQGCEVPDVSRRTLSGSESMYLVCTAQVSITNDSILNQGLVRAPLSPIRDQSREVVSVYCIRPHDNCCQVRKGRNARFGMLLSDGLHLLMSSKGGVHSLHRRRYGSSMGDQSMQG